MPTDQPSSAPQADAPAPREELTAVAVLHDDTLDQPAGGGGLAGGGLGGGGAGAGSVARGGASPNSPIDEPVPHDGADASGEARARTVADAPAEPGHGSR